MNWEILKHKSIIKKNNEEIVDLTEQVLDIDSELIPEIIDTFYVNEEMEMRPDLISYLAYGDVDSFDYILKFNSISNPYSIDKNTLILVPSKNFYNKILRNKSLEKEKDEIKTKFDSDKKVEYDPRLEKFLNEIKSKYGNKTGTFKIPVIPKENEKQIEYKNGKIIL